jgi:hypothetical protein
MLRNIRKQQDVSYMAPNSIASEAPLVASPNQAMRAIQVLRKKLYELINTGELESYTEGKSRRITVKSINEYIERRLAAEAARRAAPDRNRHSSSWALRQICGSEPVNRNASNCAPHVHRDPRFGHGAPRRGRWSFKLAVSGPRRRWKPMRRRSSVRLLAPTSIPAFCWRITRHNTLAALADLCPAMAHYHSRSSSPAAKLRHSSRGNKIAQPAILR